MSQRGRKGKPLGGGSFRHLLRVFSIKSFGIGDRLIGCVRNTVNRILSRLLMCQGDMEDTSHPIIYPQRLLSSMDKIQRWWNILSPYSQIHRYTHESELHGCLLWGQTLYLVFRSGPIDHGPNRWVWCWVQSESYKSHQKVTRKKDGI